MLSVLAKCLLVATSLAPISLVLAVNQFERGARWTTYIWPLAVAVLLALLCDLVLKYAKKNAQKDSLHIKNFERNDREVLTFLFVYLLPFVRGSTFASEWITSVTVLTIIVVVVAHVGAFHFNPVMYSFGYRFYSVINREGLSNLLISRTNLRRPGTDVQTVRIAPSVHLHRESADA